MRAENDQGQGRRMSPLRFALLVLVLVLVVFGIIGALVTFMPQTIWLNPSEVKGKIPLVRQVNRQSLH